jgi:hypothetical protein
METIMHLAFRRFVIPHAGAEITFVKADDGTIQSLMLDQGGPRMEAKR